MFIFNPSRPNGQAYWYIPPGGNAQGKEGVDYLLGARAVIQNYLDTRAALPDTNAGDHDEEAVKAVPIAPDGEREGNSELLSQAEAVPGAIRTSPRYQAINEPEPPGPDSEEDDDTARDDDRDHEFLIEPANVSDNESKAEDEDEIVTSLDRAKTGVGASAYEALDAGDEPEADDFDKYQQIDGNLDMLDPHSSGLSEDSDSDDTRQHTEVLEMLFNVGFVQAIGGLAALDSGQLRSNALREMGKTRYVAAIHVDVDSYLDELYVPVRDGKKQRYYGPSTAVKRVSDTPLSRFLFFMPIALWSDIASESNLYHLTMISKRAEAQYTKHKRKNPMSSKTRGNFKAALQQLPPIHAVELLRMVGLLRVRTIAPNKEKLSHHWQTFDEGDISRGLFGQYMTRNRFFHIMRNLHFSDNNDDRQCTDRIWTIHPKIDTLLKTFKKGFVPPPRLSFDEGLLPSFSKYDKTRIYLKGKPHKWGTKMFLTCCAESAYCLRYAHMLFLFSAKSLCWISIHTEAFVLAPMLYCCSFEIYVGKKELASERRDPGSSQAGATVGSEQVIAVPEGPAAVVRNMRAVHGASHAERYLVVTDRFYTCASLAIQLLSMNVYLLDTVLPKRYVYNGEAYVSVPQLQACTWWDNKPVTLLVTRGSVDTECIVRREGSEQRELPCSKFVKQYQALMGGVDRHNQLRLQRYSIQMSNRWKKYSKSLFIGLVDMAIVNAYIIYRENFKQRQQTPPLTHVQFLKELHLQLLQQTETDVSQAARGVIVSPTLPSRRTTDHVAVEVDE
ncbi:unnamed protein product [Phytophthora fragariaefolia]|uniref:Unnamed protein product n=1 Tax=Phytophthora fragariaefolia TaxID=1490495 RepID=A0A9W7CMX5_9STRA|nr:unnamed protein product [Phytophthora fragariaefolia]